MTWPAIAALVLIAICAIPRSPLPLLYLSFILSAFLTLSLNPSENGPNILPGAVCSVFFVLKVVLPGRQLPKAVDAAIEPSKLSILFMFLGWALFTSYVLPRLFARMIEVVPLNGDSKWPVTLTPITANYSQSAYMMLSVGVVLAFYLLGESANFRRHYMQAALLGGLAWMATGIADMCFDDEVLKPFRNAKYALLTTAEFSGSKRIVGLTPEASSFGSACVASLATLAFLRPCMENKWLRNLFAPVTIAGLLAMAAASLSSTALGGLAIFGTVFAANWLRRAVTPDAPARDGLKWEAITVIAAVLTLLALMLTFSQLTDKGYGFIDTLIFKKSESSSYEERTRFTMTALHAFGYTYGLGVGLGSVMTSNWFVAILASTGVFGATLLFGFILRLYFLRCRSQDPVIKELTLGLKLALLPYFAMQAASAITPDIGVGAASQLGLIARLTSKEAEPALSRTVARSSRARAASRPALS